MHVSKIFLNFKGSTRWYFTSILYLTAPFLPFKWQPVIDIYWECYRLKMILEFVCMCHKIKIIETKILLHTQTPFVYYLPRRYRIVFRRKLLEGYLPEKRKKQICKYDKLYFIYVRFKIITMYLRKFTSLLTHSNSQ